jgi:hypothetical protein
LSADKICLSYFLKYLSGGWLKAKENKTTARIKRDFLKTNELTQWNRKQRPPRDFFSLPK